MEMECAKLQWTIAMYLVLSAICGAANRLDSKNTTSDTEAITAVESNRAVATTGYSGGYPKAVYDDGICKTG